MNGTIQKKKDSLSDFQGLLFMFECVVVIITQKEIHTLQGYARKDLHCDETFNTGNSESCLCNSIVMIVYTLRVKT